MRNERPDETAVGRLRAQLLAAFDQFEEEREAEQRQYEPAESSGLERLAQEYARAATATARAALAERVGPSLSLTEAGVIRRTAKAVEGALPSVIVGARVDGWTAAEIAAELGMTTSYVHRILRNNPWDAVWTMYRATGDDTWEPIESGTLCATESAASVADQILGKRLDHSLASSGARLCVWRTGEEGDPDDARFTAKHDGDTIRDH
ncbi:hypothetical protein FNV60_28650 [Streptomyces sp. RLB3-5]|uniref:hypothetical protein n=1 Tax=unclassified Streptomyces TaxID=2593676 RepID=UPI0011654373|nr:MULTISPECIES: hypothetical protein [unclassified Streptomyces]QDO51678.1 hypothetical protein FNV60_28650 [Streptomyces sp. RLB3-5]QDO61920.1 hypothetical protein FNV59_30895 [Streptomyces sp. RLB1-8]